MWKSLIKKSKQFNIPKVKTKPNSKVVVEICYTKSVVDVIWQDGTKETGVSSTDLYPVQTLDDLEFFPGDFVTEKNPASDVYGVVESVDHKERTAHIQWFKVYPENPSLPHPIEKTYFSVYDLRDHPDFHFKSGCLIIHINPDTNQDLNTLTAGQVLSAGPDGRILVMWVNGEKTECWPQELFVVKLNDDGFSFQDEEYDDEDDDAPLAVEDDLSEDWMSITSPGSSNKSCDQENDEQKYVKLLLQLLKQSATSIKLFLDAVQQNRDMDKVLKLKKALEQYRLGFNVSSFLHTSESKEKELETWYKDLMDNMSTLINKIISRINIKEREGEIVEEEELSYENLVKDSVTKLKQLMSDFIKKVNLLFNETYSSKYGIIIKRDANDESDDFNIQIIEVTESASVLPVIEPDPAECRYLSVDTKPVNEVTRPEYNKSITKPEEAGVFDVVETLMDNSHKYINDKDNLNSSLPKVIAKDIQILQKSLPAGIWVKTFENRVDLFSIMIRGPEKTPYAGGLFLFDVKIPPTYPIQPPLCHYYSYCDDRLNPNLYEDGKVCLSLLGTWSGHGVELWSPNDSNLLQLLVSIQGGENAFLYLLQC
jgi:ubiquitin-conjugating enzyme E2 O